VDTQEEIGSETMTYVKLGVAPVEEKLVQHRLRWFEHMQQRPADAPIRNGVIRRTDNNKKDRGRPNLGGVYEEGFEGLVYHQGTSIR
jgi:hypothetical protein